MADEVGLTNHPTIKELRRPSAADATSCIYVFDENQPRWMDEHSNWLVHRVLTEDADPAHPASEKKDFRVPGTEGPAAPARASAQDVVKIGGMVKRPGRIASVSRPTTTECQQITRGPEQW